MNSEIAVAIIAASSSIMIAALTFYLTKRHELKVQWQREKLNHYKVLFSSISDLAVNGIDIDAATMRFSLASNTIVLVAPQYVITALMAFQDEIKISNTNRTQASHDKALKVLVLAVRKDLGLAGEDDTNSFTFHLYGLALKKKT